MSDTRKAQLAQTELAARVAAEAASVRTIRGAPPTVTTAGSSNTILGIGIGAVVLVVVAVTLTVVAMRKWG